MDIKKIDWKLFREYIESEYEKAAAFDFLDALELHGADYAEEAERFSMEDMEYFCEIRSLLDDGKYKEVMEKHGYIPMHCVYFDGVCYDWEGIESDLWDMMCQETDVEKRLEKYRLYGLVVEGKYDEAIQTLGKEFMKDYIC